MHFFSFHLQTIDGVITGWAPEAEKIFARSRSDNPLLPLPDLPCFLIPPTRPPPPVSPSSTTFSLPSFSVYVDSLPSIRPPFRLTGRPEQWDELNRIRKSGRNRTRNATRMIVILARSDSPPTQACTRAWSCLWSGWPLPEWRTD